jgi:hypothetical protein
MEMSGLRYSRLRVFVFGKVMSGTDRKISSFEQIFRMAGIISERFKRLSNVKRTHESKHTCGQGKSGAQRSVRGGQATAGLRAPVSGPAQQAPADAFNSRAPGLGNRPKTVCVFYYCRTYYKADRVGGGGEWRTCAMRDDEPRPVWMSLLITH